MAARNSRRARQAFTLVELLVVIAIIGVLVALLLPAVQAAREAARRTQCTNQVRQMCLAILNLENAHKVFPTGGIKPWPNIEDYSQGGKPFGPKKQGLSWAFQILPFLEEDAVHNLSSTSQIADTPVGLYFCPSRRAPTSNLEGGARYWLMDYAAFTAAPSRSKVGNALFTALLQINNPVVPNSLPTSRGCAQAYSYWGVINYSNVHEPAPRSNLNNFTGFWGVIVRSSHYVVNGTTVNLDYSPMIRMEKIKDGTSKTAMITEKRLRVPYLTGGANQSPDDDRGWSDGWDLDTIRLSICPPYPDSAKRIIGLGGAGDGTYVTAGAAHQAGMMVGFADSSTRMLSYDVDLETLNRMANRIDGEIYVDPTN